MKGAINQEVSTLIGRVNKVIHQFKVVLDKEFNTNMEKVAEETKKTISELEGITRKANQRFESYYNRKKWLDYLLFGYITLTPILLGVIVYLILKG